MAVPVKYREIGDFHEYYSGKRTAPYLTIFIGGNHEASNHMRELYYGGWAAPNIFYMGAANIVRLGSLRIAGMSGIWKGYDYRRPHFERLPYNGDDVRSAFHTRELDVRKLLQVRTQVDIGLSHDWPQGIEWLGDHNKLFRQKSFFEEDARSGRLGSQAARYVLEHLRPPYWFSAHLHVKFAAVVEHAATSAVDSLSQENSNKAVEPGPDKDKNTAEQEPSAPTNEDEIDLGEDIDVVVPPAAPLAQEATATNSSTSAVDEALRAQLPDSFKKQAPPPREPDPPTNIPNTTTQFLALDKCLPRRDFLQLLEISSVDTSSTRTETETDTLRLEYDPEWLAITRVFAEHVKTGDIDAQTPRDQGKAHYRPLIEQAEAFVAEHIVTQGKLVIPENFVLTATPFESGESIQAPPQPREYSNPQTEAFCELLGIPNPFYATEDEIQQRLQMAPRPQEDRGFRGGRGGGGGGGRGRGRGRGGGRGRGRF